MLPLHVLKMTNEFGRGLYAAYGIETDVLLFTCELLVLSEADTMIVEKTDLKYYTFKYNNAQDCLVLGDGEIFNHSDTPNVGYKLIEFDGRKVMAFFTLRAIEATEQLFIDYNADVEVKTENYTVNLIGG